jgi:hypothetical protein
MDKKLYYFHTETAVNDTLKNWKEVFGIEVYSLIKGGVLVPSEEYGLME